MEKGLDQRSAEPLLRLLNESGVEYAVLHGWQNLPEHLPSDLDIVVSAKGMSKLVNSLLAYSIVNILQHEDTCYYFVLAKDQAQELASLDAAIDYRRNGRIWFGEQELLLGRLQYRGFWIAAPEVEFRYLLVKKVLKASFPKRARQRLSHLIRELGKGTREEVQRLMGNFWAPKVIAWLEAGDWDAFERHANALKRALLWERLKRDPLNPLRYWIPEIVRIWRRWCEPTGLVVAILGPDGAGKSSVISEVRQRLAGAFRSTRAFHLRPRAGKADGAPVRNPHAKPPWPFVTSLVKLGFYLVDFVQGYWLRVRPASVRSTLVLFDRYYHDLLVDPKRYRYGGPMWAARLIGALIPKPDLFIVLDLPAEVAHARKPEVPLEEARRLRERYVALARRLPNAQVVDASRSLDQVVAEVEEIVLAKMAARTKARLKRWGLA